MTHPAVGYVSLKILKLDIWNSSLINFSCIRKSFENQKVINIFILHVTSTVWSEKCISP